MIKSSTYSARRRIAGLLGSTGAFDRREALSLTGRGLAVSDELKRIADAPALDRRAAIRAVREMMRCARDLRAVIGKIEADHRPNETKE